MTGRHAASTSPDAYAIRRGGSVPNGNRTRNVRHARQAKKNRRWTRALLAGLLAIVLGAGTAGGLVWQDLQSNVSARSVDDLLGTDRPTAPAPVSDPTEKPARTPGDPFAGQAVNLLVMGSDIRDGQDGAYGDFEGMRSDTTVLVHVSADRKRVELVSIPRDSWVNIPACERSDGSWSSPATTKFNAAFAYGGAHGDVASAAACTIKTVESLTGVFVDAYAVIDFSGFAAVVDALGGVEMDIPERIDSPKANLYLEPGRQTLDGETALAYARARSGEGLNGSDISRIDRQQELFEAILGKALRKMTDVKALYDFLSAATSTVTASPNIARLQSAAGLAWSLRNLDGDDLDFLTVPIADRGDGANVIWTDAADQMWKDIINDVALVEDEPETADSESDADTTIATVH